jgi:hypothetical protein
MLESSIGEDVLAFVIELKLLIIFLFFYDDKGKKIIYLVPRITLFL